MTSTTPKRAGRVAWTERDPAIIAVVGLVLIALLLIVAGSWQRLPFVDHSTSYRAEFTDAAMYLAPQIIGDTFKLVSLVFVYYLMSLNQAWVLAGMELLQAAVILAAYLLLVPSLGDRAAVTSYAIATLIVMMATLGLVAANRRTLA